MDREKAVELVRAIKADQKVNEITLRAAVLYWNREYWVTRTKALKTFVDIFKAAGTALKEVSGTEEVIVESHMKEVRKCRHVRNAKPMSKH